jgi:hypothetical protein
MREAWPGLGLVILATVSAACDAAHRVAGRTLTVPAGRVADSRGLPLAGATVTLLRREKLLFRDTTMRGIAEVVTDEQGGYTVDTLGGWIVSSDAYVIRFSKPGYEQVEVPLDHDIDVPGVRVTSCHHGAFCRIVNVTMVRASPTP